MHFELKSISEQGIPEALAKVERYRLLNEPSLAESICLDILAIMPDHQEALISLLLAHTDQFESQVHVRGARETLEKIKGEYEQAYYEGIIWERLGISRLRYGGDAAGGSAYHALHEAIDHYETAIKLAPSGNDDAILRWNTCARLIMQNPQIEPGPDSEVGELWELDEAGSRIADA